MAPFSCIRYQSLDAIDLEPVSGIPFTNLFISQSIKHNTVKNYNRLNTGRINLHGKKHTLLLGHNGNQLFHILHHQVVGVIQKLKPMIGRLRKQI